jgi:hypothetical protein
MQKEKTPQETREIAVQLLQDFKEFRTKNHSELEQGLSLMFTTYFQHNRHWQGEIKDSTEKVLESYYFFCKLITKADELFNSKIAE